MAATQKTTKKKPARSTDRRNIWLLIITTLLVLGSVFMFMPPQEKINQGLDIQGGLSVVLTAKSTDGADVTNDDMEKSRAIIESRVNALGASEAVVQVQGTDQILVQIPGLTNTEDALNTIGKTGKLEFARLDSFTDEDAKQKIESGQASGEGHVSDDLGVLTLPTGETQHLKVEDGTYTPIVTGADITKVDIGKPSETSTDYAVNITLDAEGAKAFADATKELAPTKGKIVIILDNEVQSAPAVQSEIPDGNVQITGGYSLDEAKAIIGLAVVMLYLLFFYRGLGLITAAAMIVFAVLYLGILATLSSFGLFSLSLAGIAGIVLTIGMAADSSILTMERFREEIRMGRSVRAASVTGVKHAIVTSIDADLVTLVSALSLFFLASASVKGFGLTLALGIACDIAMMLLFKAPLIRLLAPKVIARHPGFWGIKDSLAASKDYAALAAAEGTSTAAAEAGEAINAAESEEAAQRAEGAAGEAAARAARKPQGKFIKHDINFLGHRRVFLGVAAVLVCVSLAIVGVKGLNFGIEFVGGTSVSFHNTGDVSTEQMRTAFNDAGEPDAVVQTTTADGDQGFLVRQAGAVHRQLRGDHHRPGLGRQRHPVVAHRVPRVHRAHHHLHRHPLRVQDGRHCHRGAAARPGAGHGRVRAGGPRGEPEHHRRAAHHPGVLAVRHGGRVPPHQRQHAVRRHQVHVHDDGEPLHQPGAGAYHQHDAHLADPGAGHAAVRRRDAEGLRVRHGNRPRVRLVLVHRGGVAFVRDVEDARALLPEAGEEVRARGRPVRVRQPERDGGDAFRQEGREGHGRGCVRRAGGREAPGRRAARRERVEDRAEAPEGQAQEAPREEVAPNGPGHPGPFFARSV